MQFNNVLVYVVLAAGFTKLVMNLWLDHPAPPRDGNARFGLPVLLRQDGHAYAHGRSARCRAGSPVSRLSCA
jgi:hypothetical protein